MSSRELCFVWGPPLSGQRYWMHQTARATEAGKKAELLSLEAYSDGATPLEALLERVGALLETGDFDHLYCELPWSILDEDILLEEWIASRPELREPNASCSLSFVGLCPADAERLPQSVRTGLEEFSRAARSAVIVPRVKGGAEGPPSWWGTPLLDFGRLVEVFEEDLWPAESEEVRGEAHKAKLDDLQALTIPVQGTRETYVEIFRDLCGGRYGAIWGAEVAWRNEAGVFEALTLSQGRLYSWTSHHPSLERSAPANGALFHVAGDLERSAELLSALRAQTFC